MMPEKAPECPRCGGGIPDDENPGLYPGAISRWDNETEVCSWCGLEEAVFQRQKHRRHAVVHPVTGARPWVTPPAGLS
jgi:hypothetical protein